MELDRARLAHDHIAVRCRGGLNADIVADDDTVAQGGMALSAAQRGTAQGDAVIEGDIVTDDRGLADNHTAAMVDEQPLAYDGARMNLDTGQQFANMRDHARQQRQFEIPGGACPTIESQTTSSPERAAGSRARIESISSRSLLKIMAHSMLCYAAREKGHPAPKWVYRISDLTGQELPGRFGAVQTQTGPSCLSAGGNS